MKKTILTLSVIGGLWFTIPTISADETTVTPEPQVPEPQVTQPTLETLISQLKINRQVLILQKKDMELKGAKAQQINIESQLDANQQKLTKAENEKRVADEKRKAEEERQRLKQQQEEAIQKNQPIPSVVNPNYTQGNNSYPWGQCTWGAKNLAPWAGNYWGNATQWPASARANGFRVGTVPVAGAIMIFHNGYYGHAAFVKEVRADGYIQILEANYGGTADAADPRGIGNYRGWFKPVGNISYIYPKNG